MRALAIIPARGGSKRLSGKNIKPLLGRPLLAYAIEAARGARGAARCVVSSDDEEILAIARAIDPQLVLRRPDELAQDDSPSIDAVRHAVAELEAAGEAHFDATVIIQATNPLVLPEDIDRCLAQVAAGADSAVTVRSVGPLHPAKLKRLRDGWVEPYFPSAAEIEGTRGQDLDAAYVRTGSVYATSRAVLDRNSLYGDRIAGVAVGRERSADIDDEFDFALAEFLLLRQRAAKTS